MEGYQSDLLKCSCHKTLSLYQFIIQKLMPLKQISQIKSLFFSKNLESLIILNRKRIEKKITKFRLRGSSTGAPSRCTTVRNQREVSKAKRLHARRLRTVVYSCPLSPLAAYQWAMATSKVLQNTVTARYPRGNRFQDHLWIPNPQQYQYYWPFPSVDSASSDSTDQRMVESMDAEPTDTESRVVQALESNHLVEY